MRTLILVFGITTFSAFSTGAFAQAAAEAALVHSMSSANGTAVGTALGRATNQMSERLGQQTANNVQRRVTTIKPGLQRQTRVPRATATEPTGRVANGGHASDGSMNDGSIKAGSMNNASMIVSIQGGRLQQPNVECTTVSPTPQTGAPTGNGATGVAPVPANPGRLDAKEPGSNCTQPAVIKGGDPYQSVITLPAAR